MNQLGELAYHIWDIEFGDHSSSLERERNALLISGYLDVNLGQLNTLLNTDFHLNKTKDEVEPALQYEEKAIFTQLYLKDYMQKQARNVLRNATVTSSTTTTTAGVTDWVELREGDTSIRRSIATSTSKNASAKIFQDSSRDAMALLEKMVHSYNMYGSLPLQVAGVDGGVEDANYQIQESKDLVQEVEDLKEAVAQLDNLQSQIDQIKLDIAASKINGYAKTTIIPQGQDSIFIDWSNEFSPQTTPTVLATLRSADEDDPIIAYRIEGAVSLGGVRFVFSSKTPSNNYALEVAAFIID
jgi:CheY-like chemotaxis protein